MPNLTRRAATLLTAAALAGCTMVGPTVPVTPGPGRTQAVFEADRRACMTATDGQLQPVAGRSSAAALAGGQRTVTTADLQRLYNASYGQCMAARGNTVTATSGGPRFPSDTLQAATDLTDPDSMAARQAVQDVVASSQRGCAGERIVVTVTEAPISPATKARLLALSTPYGGSCFGQPGQNSYLVARQGAGWSRLLSAEPGSIELLPGRHNGFRDVQQNSLGSCTYKFAWNGSRYTQAGSDQCATAAPPTLGSLAAATRGGAQASGIQTVACPATSAGRPLSRAGSGTLFDGDPAQLAALAPSGTSAGPNGDFVNTWRVPAGNAYVLACHYTGGADLHLPLGPAARTCRQDSGSFVCR